MHARLTCALLLLTLSARAAEHRFDFSSMRQGGSIVGFRSAVMGKGQPGDWKILLDDVPPLLQPLTANPAATTKQAVLAQLAQDPTDEHFPMLIYEDEVYGDFTLTTRFKLMKGVMEQMAGIAFRAQNESNYYLVRASALGSTFKFYKVLNGNRGPLVGPDMPISAETWHDLAIECKGLQIRCSLDGKEYISLTDKANALTSGKIAFWTKSDAVSYFVDTKIVYTQFEPPAQALVREMMKRYPRLLGLKIYVPGKESGTTRLVASKDPEELGKPGTKTEQEVIARAETYYGKEKDYVSVIMPLRDRNGEAIAAVRVMMKSFKGQTEENAIIRAAPIVKDLQSRIQTLEDLSE